MVPARINGKDAELIVDTGAFFSLLTPAAASRFGMKIGPLPPNYTIGGVNGVANIGLAKASTVDLVGGRLKGVEFLTGAGSIEGAADGLLGRNLMARGDMEFDFAHGAIRIFKVQGCKGASLAYWAKDGNFSTLPLIIPEDVKDIHGEVIPFEKPIIATVYINGVRATAMFDTGASRSLLSRAIAAKAGVTRRDDTARAGGQINGVGRRAVSAWIAPFASVKIGDEDIRNTQLLVGDFQGDDIDMLIGADFFLSHRVLVSRSQKLIYITPLGGPVFKVHGGVPLQATLTAAAPGSETLTAGEYARRGAALIARRDYAAGIADLGRAIELDAQTASYWRQRGVARMQASWSVMPKSDRHHALIMSDVDRALAMSDLDHALNLSPDDAKALFARGVLRLSLKDEAGARNDFGAAVAVEPTMMLSAGGAYAMSGKFDAALDFFNRWIVAHPRHEQLHAALNARCWTRAVWGRELDLALADCDLALRNRRGDAVILDSRGLVRLRLKQYDAAIADYNAALKRQPKQTWSLYGRGLARLAKGLKAEGEADIAAATAIDPDIVAQARDYGVTP